ncbi:MAG TPA: ABC transporter permease [Acidobacteriaceae bacterium]|nr:ABC transporter permease [Acidobacteriaceae bacterium]
MPRIRNILKSVSSAIWRGFRRGSRTELEDELAFHLDQAMQANLAAGMSESEARRQALVDFGGVEQAREETWRQRPGWLLETMLQDVRYALRGFRRNLGFTIAVIATLALGIGATTAVFSVVDRILFRSLPYAQDDRLVSMGLVQSLEKQEFMLGGFFYEWRDNQTPFTSVTFERGVSDCNLTEANPEHLQCAQVAENFLPTLGIAPVLGRNFLPEEDLPHGPRVALISDELWLSRYNRDPGILARTITIDEHPVRIVGVLPKDFQMPRLQHADIVLPAAMDVAAQHTVNSGIGYPMWAFARLKPGITIEQARAAMEPIYRHTQQWIPAQFRNEFRLQIRSIRDRQMQEAYMVAWVLLGAVLAVLLIACANVGSLFSARGAARERELAVRSALGASRSRLVRQTLSEALLLALAAAVLGCALAWILLRVFIAIAPTGIPFLAESRLDLRIVLFSILVALFSAALFGIVPALQKPRAVALAARATGSAGRTGAAARLRRTLVATQIAASVVLVSGAGLLLRSFWNLQQQSLGMDTRNVLSVRVPLNGERYPSGRAIMDFYLRAETALHGVPGVTAVGITNSLPPDGNSWHNGMRFDEIFVAGRAPTPVGTGGTIVERTVTPAYFRILQIPIVQGSPFTEAERNSKGNFIILSKLLAERLFPGGKAVGQRVQFATYRPYFILDEPVYTIVGVAGNVKNAGLAGQDDPELYTLRSSNHNLDSWNPQHCLLLLQSELPSTIVIPLIRSQIAQIDPNAPVEVEALTQSVSKLADRPRFETALLGLFAFTGLLMSMIGLYGVISFLAAQRTQEIGIRMALGADHGDILRLIASEGVRLIAIGGLLGIAAAMGVTQLLRNLLFGVSPHDPLTYVGVILLLALVALIATLIPARRAMRVNPVEALRCE